MKEKLKVVTTKKSKKSKSSVECEWQEFEAINWNNTTISGQFYHHACVQLLQHLSQLVQMLGSLYNFYFILKFMINFINYFQFKISSITLTLSMSNFCNLRSKPAVSNTRARTACGPREGLNITKNEEFKRNIKRT